MQNNQEVASAIEHKIVFEGCTRAEAIGLIKDALDLKDRRIAELEKDVAFYKQEVLVKSHQTEKVREELATFRELSDLRLEGETAQRKEVMRLESIIEGMKEK